MGGCAVCIDVEGLVGEKYEVILFFCVWVCDFFCCFLFIRCFCRFLVFIFCFCCFLSLFWSLELVRSWCGGGWSLGPIPTVPHCAEGTLCGCSGAVDLGFI